MRCKACNAILEDSEAVRKDTHGEFIDLCSICLRASYQTDNDDDASDDYLATDIPELFMGNTRIVATED